MLLQRRKHLLFCLIAMLSLLHGCGQKGALFLPEKEREEEKQVSIVPSSHASVVLQGGIVSVSMTSG